MLATIFCRKKKSGGSGKKHLFWTLGHNYPQEMTSICSYCFFLYLSLSLSFFFKIGSFGNSLYQSSSTSVLLTSWNGIFLRVPSSVCYVYQYSGFYPGDARNNSYCESLHTCRHRKTAPAGTDKQPLQGKITPGENCYPYQAKLLIVPDEQRENTQ